MVRVYICQKMSGLTWREAILKASAATQALKGFGCEYYSPVLDEWKRRFKEIPGENLADRWNRALIEQQQPIGGGDLAEHWRRDKQEMVRCHVLWDITPDAHSFGSSEERGFFRYTLWKPCVRRMPRGENIASLEGDLCEEGWFFAAEAIQERWGRWHNRALWRVQMLLRSLPRWLWRQVLAWS